MPMIRESLGKAMGYSQVQIDQMTFKDGYRIADQLKCEQFEGAKRNYSIDTSSWGYAR